MTFKTFKDIADLWPTRTAWADALGLSYPIAMSIIGRGSARAKHFNAIVEACRKIGRPEITHELLCQIAEDSAKRS